MSKGERTRERILELAEAAVLQKGFASTSIDELTAAAEITKSGFLYHFKDKSDLAKHLLLRYLERDEEILNGLFARADDLSSDPLQSLLIFIKLFSEMTADMPSGHPGCLAASYAYQEQLFNKEVRDLNRQGVLSWRSRFLERLHLVMEKYPPKKAVDVDALADNFSALVEGGIVMSMALGDKTILPRQILIGRDHLEFLFSPA